MTDNNTLAKALLAIKKLKQQLELVNHKTDVIEPVALVGIGCRFPGASHKQDFWQLLREGKNIISRIPAKRWQLLKDSAEAQIKSRAEQCYGGFLDDIDAFDAYFFGISPREALRMDPQQRLLLEVTYEAIEDAGIPVESLSGSKTGVFCSLYASQFAYMQTLQHDQDALYVPTGNAVSMAANRLSYLFDLHGPSVVFDTACSSSLVAIHHAILNIQSHSCDIALVAAANINLQPSMNVLLSRAKMLSPTGQCHTFDAAANGYVQGEGVGVLVLKPLSTALRDGDRIYSVIMGSAINQDGKTNGLTAPNGLQQEALLKEAYKKANCELRDVSYIECHGTGTFLGDPIEAEALGNAIGKHHTVEQPLWMGSLKTNIGHLEPAAGVAGIIKVALSLQHQQIPPHLNFNTPNPHIAFDRYHLRIPQTITAWPLYGKQRIAGVSSFGFGGTNAHIVMRELTEEEKPCFTENHEHREQLFVLSAKDTTAFNLLIAQWCRFLENNESIDLAALCYNVQTRRSHYFYRLAIIARSATELLAKLTSLTTQPLAAAHPAADIFINLQKESIAKVSCAADSLQALAHAYIHREKINWKTIHAGKKFPFIEMPHYPWQHQHYWPDMQNAASAGNPISYPYAGKKLASPLKSRQFEFQFDSRIMPEIHDTFNFLHIGYYLEMLAFAVNEITGQVKFTVQNLEFFTALSVPDNTIVTVQVVIEEKPGNEFAVTFYSQSETHQWIRHAAGDLTYGSLAATHDSLNDTALTGSEAEFYSRVKTMRMPGDGSIRWIKQYALHQDNKIVCQLAAPDSARENHVFKLNIHPGVFDACVQSLFMLLPDSLLKPFVAARIGKIDFSGYHNEALQLHAAMKNIADNGEQYTGDFCLMDKAGHVIAHCHGLQMTQLNQNMRLDDKTHSIKEELTTNLTPEQRRKKILQYLNEQAALLLAMPQNDIGLTTPLNQLGIDSLMAMAFSTMIESDLGAHFPSHAMLKGATLTDIFHFVVEKTPHAKVIPETSHHPWIANRSTNKAVKSRLFCFPYGGGGASIYYDWQKQLPDSIEVCAIQLPGREERLDEVPIGQFDLLIDLLRINLQKEFDKPFAFFGHSFGALMAFELARSLRRHGLPQPRALFASAFPDPAKPTRSLDNMIAELKTIHVDLFDLQDPAKISMLSDDALNALANIFRQNGLVEYGNLAMSKDIIKLLLPIFIADMSLVKDYHYTVEAPLPCPITVFAGKQDNWVPYDDHLGWSAQTQKFSIHAFDSGHLFIRDARFRNEVLQIIAAALNDESVIVSA